MANFNRLDVQLAEVQSGKIIASQIKQKSEDIETITGLDFARFTKSMMLSQGEFAAFLNAKESERAELLEELTGTEIYGLISEKVHEKFTQAKQALSELESRAKGVKLLTEEQKEDLEQELQELRQKQQALKSKQASCHEHITWLNDHEKAKTTQLVANEQFDLARHKQEREGPKLLRLSQAEPAEKLRAPYALWNDSVKQTDNMQMLLSEKEVSVEALEDNLHKARLAHECTESHLEQVKLQQSLLEQRLNEDILPLDHQIISLQGKHDEKVQQVALWDEAYQQACASKEQLARNQLQLEAEQETVAAYLQFHQADACLSQFLGQWQLHSDQLKNEQDWLDKLTFSEREQQALMDEKQASLKVSHEQLINAKKKGVINQENTRVCQATAP